MTRIGIITQARTTSTRLPRKVLMEAGGRTMLDHHLDRLSVSGLDVYVATTVNPADDPIASIAEARGLSVHRGSENDVLSRFHECARTNDLDIVVRVTSDCPLIDGRLITDAVDFFIAQADPHLYVSNGLKRTFPRGLDFEVFSAEALADAHRHARGQSEREHVTPYLYANVGGDMRLHNIGWPEDKSGYRITLDTLEDLEVIRRMIEVHAAQRLECGALIRLLDEHPEITSLNAHIQQKKPED